jgi:hypothetical protein
MEDEGQRTDTMVEAWRLEEIKREENKVNNNPQRPRL